MEQRLLPSFHWWRYLRPGPGNGASPSAPMRDRWRLKNGAAVAIRVAQSGDAPLMQDMVRGLSMESRYHRFFYPVRELTPDLLDRFVQADPMGSMTLLAVSGKGKDEVAVGMAQCAADPYPLRGEFAVVVTDAWQRLGIATRLLRNVICIARAAGIERLEGDIMSDNEPMRRLLAGMGFETGIHPDGAYLEKAWKVLDQPTRDCSGLTGLVAGRSHQSQAVLHA
ncbi:GNAT family N-acetyltransferase [Noviherbaspirillum cavernae]|nr:GNAT family N-acetyltransferase [Noviherbaspirillum cavernae]